MFGIVIFYPAGQPIRNRSGAEKCRMHGVPLVPSRFMRKIICRLRLNEVSRQ